MDHDTSCLANEQGEMSPARRSLSTLDIALLWFAASISITEIWAGGLPPLTALGLGFGIVAILLGRSIGNGLMAALGHMGAETGLPGILLTRRALGSFGSRILALLNVAQLIGWTGWMLFVGALYCDILAAGAGLPTNAEQPLMRWFWVGLLALLCTIWSVGGERFWRMAQRATSVLLALLSVAMSVLVLQTHSIASLLAQGQGSALGLLAGVDIVVVMSVSWVPLVADYSRYALNPRDGRLGSFWGYFIGGSWMYATGLLVALATGSAAPDQMVVQLMGQAGLAWALLAVVLVLVSTVTTTFLDIFSSVVSAQVLAPRLSPRAGSIAAGLIGAACALWLDVFKYEGFLHAIGLVFLPGFSVVAADYFLLGRSRQAVSFLQSASPWNWPGVTAWLLGAVVYDWSRGWVTLAALTNLWGLSVEGKAWTSGASLPCIAVSVAAYLLLSRASTKALS